MADHSRARLFYEEVISKPDPFAFLASLINVGDSAAENGWRDYKEAGFLGRTLKPDEEKEKVKQIWSENLSAFANTGGGVLLWGFHTDGKLPDKLSLATECEALADRLRLLVNDATDPYVAGVEITAIKSPSDKSGFVICFIPQSTFPPHQALWGERTHFIRTQDANIVCPQPLLRQMFYPRVLVRLQPVVKLECFSDSRGMTWVRLAIRIQNSGPITADVAMLSIEHHDLDNATVPQGEHNWKQIGPSLWTYEFPIPPNLVVPRTIYFRGIQRPLGSNIQFVLFAHNTPAHHSTVSFSKEEAMESLQSNRPLEKVGTSHPLFP